MLRTALLLSLAAALLAAVFVAAPASGAGRPTALAAAKAATAKFQNVAAAKRAGYAVFPDAAGIRCIDNPGVGAMGVHYVNGELVGDPRVRARTPEALVYEPLAGGGRKLVAAEYIVPQDAWDAGHAAPPSLFGRRFELIGAGNRYGLPAFYELHAWLWKHNPRGTFDDWNPRVSCAAG